MSDPFYIRDGCKLYSCDLETSECKAEDGAYSPFSVEKKSPDSVSVTHRSWGSETFRLNPKTVGLDYGPKIEFRSWDLMRYREIIGRGQCGDSGSGDRLPDVVKGQGPIPNRIMKSKKHFIPMFNFRIPRKKSEVRAIVADQLEDRESSQVPSPKIVAIFHTRRDTGRVRALASEFKKHDVVVRLVEVNDQIAREESPSVLKPYLGGVVTVAHFTPESLGRSPETMRFVTSDSIAPHFEKGTAYYELYLEFLRTEGFVGDELRVTDIEYEPDVIR